MLAVGAQATTAWAFADDEARTAILELREQLKASQRAQVDLMGQVEALRSENQRMIGEMQELTRKVETMDKRLVEIEPSRVQLNGRVISVKPAERRDFENAVVENTSPTLDFSLSFDPEFTLTASRDRDAYSRYAQNAGARSLGNALRGISGVAEGDMQNLLAALDWSAPDGSAVSRALNALGPEAFDNAARASRA